MIGDWLVDGKRHYGDKMYERAAEITGYDESSLRKFASMSGKFELFRRRNNLTWGHHSEVSSIKQTTEHENGTLALGEDADNEVIQRLLDAAVRNKWSVKDLRHAVQTFKEQQRERIRLANEPEKYCIVYADPPWTYASGDQHTHETQETVIGTHYPSMTVQELCELPVRQMAATDWDAWGMEAQ